MQKKRSKATNVVVLISYDSTALMCIVYISFNLNNISGHFHKQRDCLFVGVCVRHERDSNLKLSLVTGRCVSVRIGAECLYTPPAGLSILL